MSAGGSRVEVRLLEPGDERLLEEAEEGVFDGPVRGEWARVFLADDRHHMAAALVDGRVVGFASGVHYLHPDKAPELWINEVGVAEPFRRRGLGRAVVEELLAHGRRLGCRGAWVLTEPSNDGARALYASVVGAGPPESVILVPFDTGAARAPD